ncbi:hypothetical protein CDAR_316381 [Caerostris darwini]|uniref:Uncharacterized protein n=1 Tax=Caerostris darwini TaxID=1538125 RepID=A0AAV4UKJ1_9ARAC|nr:hypothetical protein CDAR_316381 [Caerostris darwini]
MEQNSFHSSTVDDSGSPFSRSATRNGFHLSTKRNPFQSGSRLDAMIGRDASPDRHPDSDRNAGLLTISPLSDAICPPRILSQIPAPPFFYVPFRLCRTRSIFPSQTTRVFFFPDPQQGTDSICRTKRNPFQSGSRLDAMMRRDESPDRHPDSDRSAGLLTISPLSDAISPPRILSQIPPPFFRCSSPFGKRPPLDAGSRYF